jgi:hypothetical protein
MPEKELLSMLPVNARAKARKISQPEWTERCWPKSRLPA